MTVPLQSCTLTFITANGRLLAASLWQNITLVFIYKGTQTFFIFYWCLAEKKYKQDFQRLSKIIKYLLGSQYLSETLLYKYFTRNFLIYLVKIAEDEDARPAR